MCFQVEGSLWRLPQSTVSTDSHFLEDDRFTKQTKKIILRPRHLTTSCSVFHLHSFSRETPSRFRKELVKSVEHDGVVEKDGLNQILINIGRQDRLLSDEEYQLLCKEAGDNTGTLSTSNMMKLF